MKIQALSGRIIAELLSDDQTASGIYLPDNRKEKVIKAKVISTGKEYLRRDGKVIKPPCKDGDTIHLSSNWRRDMDYQGKKIFLLTFEDVHGVENAT
jgi:chaperonin GroES